MCLPRHRLIFKKEDETLRLYQAYHKAAAEANT